MQFSRDRRGQSVVIGTVILFGFLIIALSLYQVQVVPQQNAQAEFEHSGDVQNDLVDLRAGILQAGSTDRTQYQTVRLGTSYSPRVFAINPPPPAGEVRTSDSYNITIDPDSGDPINVSTRFVQYRPGYNEIDRSPTWYDTSVLYIDARDGDGGIAVIEGQNLVDDGEVQITALQNDFSRSGTGRVTLELYPTGDPNKSIPTGDLTIKIPTRLNGTEYWDGSDIPGEIYDGVTEDAYPNGVHELKLVTTKEELKINTVGIQSEASDGPVKNNVGPDTGEETYDITILDVTTDGNDITVEFDADTTDGGAQVRIQSIDDGGNVFKTTELLPVSETQPQTESVKGANQATDVRVILYDADGAEQDRQTAPL